MTEDWTVKQIQSAEIPSTDSRHSPEGRGRNTDQESHLESANTFDSVWNHGAVSS